MNKEAKVITSKIAVEMSREERAFYQFAIKRLKHLQISRKKSLQLMNDTFDLVNNKSAVVTKKGEQYFVGSALSKRDIAKVEFAQKYINQYQKKAIIYTLDDRVAKSLAKVVTGATYIDGNKEKSIEKVINQAIENSVAIININHCKTGIDIHADAILWYQTPISVSDDLQGSGRITRLSSSQDKPKEITYLYYDNTLQQEWIEELALAYMINATMANKVDETDDKPKLPMGLSF